MRNCCLSDLCSLLCSESEVCGQQTSLICKLLPSDPPDFYLRMGLIFPSPVLHLLISGRKEAFICTLKALCMQY